jgi:hypothetical protein
MMRREREKERKNHNTKTGEAGGCRKQEQQYLELLFCYGRLSPVDPFPARPVAHTSPMCVVGKKCVRGMYGDNKTL